MLRLYHINQQTQENCHGALLNYNKFSRKQFVAVVPMILLSWTSLKKQLVLHYFGVVGKLNYNVLNYGYLPPSQRPS